MAIVSDGRAIWSGLSARMVSAFCAPPDAGITTAAVATNAHRDINVLI
jgi:hypothetical protein